MALPTVITVSGTFLKTDNTPESGTITFRAKQLVLDSDSASIMAPGPISDVLDGAGSFSVSLPSTNDPDWTPVGWTYEVTVSLSQSFTKYNIQVPYDAPGAAATLSSLTPVTSVSGSYYAPYSHEHAGYVTDAELVAQVTDVIENSSAVEDAVDAALATALTPYAPKESPTFTGTVSGITKAMVGLGNVDNTSDTAKPVSTAQQTALDLKANLASPTFTGTVSGITKSMVGLGNADNTSDANKPVSTAQQIALNATSQAIDHALGGWTFDPICVQGATVLATAGLSYVVRIRVMSATVTNIHFHFTVGGSSLTSGQCFASLHNDAGAILGAGAVTADQSTSWASGGFKTCALTVAQGVTAGDWYKVRFWFNGTTGPTLSRGINSSAAITNANLSGTTNRFGTADSGLTTSAGAPGTIGTITGGATAWWVAVS